MQTQQFYDEKCKNCPKNPKAEKPHVKMKRVNYDEKTHKRLEKQAKEWGVSESCVACRLLNIFMKEQGIKATA